MEYLNGLIFLGWIKTDSSGVAFLVLLLEQGIAMSGDWGFPKVLMGSSWALTILRALVSLTGGPACFTAGDQLCLRLSLCLEKGTNGETQTAFSPL